MYIYIKNHTVTVPLMEIVHAYTGEKALLTEDESVAGIKSVYLGNFTVETTITVDGSQHKDTYIHSPGFERNEYQSIIDAVKIGFYRLAVSIWGKTLEWGCCTGIRPAKIAERYVRSGEGIDGFIRDFGVGEKKASLALEVATVQKQLDLNTDDVSIYIGIPFCPTRCLYCSFVSLPMDKQKKAVKPYIDMLCTQIEKVSEIIKKAGKNINTVYIGGGTPTSISADNLDTLLNYVSKRLISKNVKEFTVEAGRPDTISEEKLRTLKNHGVSRISINPQTLNDNILENIGRKHTTQQFINAFEMARKIGFDNINSDIIAGLPGETPEMFKNSLKQLIDMNPEGITVHTLCVKRAAELKQKLDTVTLGGASEFVDLSYSLLKDAGYIPYYMYRQKDTLDNLENTGYSKKGKECLYNVFMMEDMGSVIGIGGGSVSKIIDHKTDRIDRVFNLKHPHEYIKNPDATEERNKKLLELLLHS